MLQISKDTEYIPSKLRITFEDIDCANGVGAEEPKAQQSEGEEEDRPRIPVRVSTL